MENGTVILKSDNGRMQKGKIARVDPTSYGGIGIIVEEVEDFIDTPEPFNDGKYLHYTRFHPQLRDMIGTEGYFYDDNAVFNKCTKGVLSGVNKQGLPIKNTNSVWAYFAFPIKQPKTELTLQQIADKFGVDVDSLRIKE